ncbi:MAG TPA: hypothetical protein VJV39_24435 [Dongiaceae bacterium]|nr:hypothetical protein [Dongiaceae bacterium]
MAKVLLMVIGLLVLSIAGLGGLIWKAGSQPIDPGTESGKDYAQSFKATVTGRCNRFVDSRLATLGDLAEDEDLKDLIKETAQDICECAADLSYKEFKNESPFQLISLTSDPKGQARIKEIMQECLDRADIPRFDELEQAGMSDESGSEEE